MYLSKCSPACGSAIVLQLSYLWVFSCMCCSTWMVLPCPACFIWPELSPLTEKHRCHKWRSKRCIVSFQIWESNQAWEGSWSLYSSAKGGTRKSVGRGLDGHYPQWQQISFWCSTTLPIFNSSSLTRGARSPDTQHWWNVFPTGQSKRNGMKIWEHRALPPNEPSCQMTNIIDCNLLTFLCGDWVDRYSTFIIPYPGTLETCFRRIGRARSCTLLLVSLLSSSMFTCFYLYIIQFNVFDHCPSHMALVWVMLMPHAECYGWAFNWSRCSCHTGSNYIIKKKHRTPNPTANALDKNLLEQTEAKTHNLSRDALAQWQDPTRTSSKRVWSSDSVQEWPPHRILSALWIRLWKG